MSTAAIPPSTLFPELQDFVQQRQTDLQLLRQSLLAGNLAGARQQFSILQTAAVQNGPLTNHNPQSTQQQQFLTALGQALQAGDLAGAQQALTQLDNTIRQSLVSHLQGTTAAPGPVAQEPEVILNLGSLTPGEQVTIGLTNNGPNGTEQITVNLANPQTPSPEQVTFSLQQANNERLILNFNGASPTANRGQALNTAA